MTQPTFNRQETINKPGIVGARWWQQSIATQVPRRQAMTGLLVLGGVLAATAAIGTCVAIVASDSPAPGTPGSDVQFQPRSALDMQKEYGWNFGAVDEALVFDGQSTSAFDRTALASMAADLAPSEPRHAPFFIATLFQSPPALPKSKPSGEESETTFKPLKEVLVPISNYLTEQAFNRGKAFASLIDRIPRAKDVTVIVDLPGPEAVAFAAGASSVLDPIFLFDNWPHPRGVVPAHLTLASAAYYQPLLAKARASRPKGARPMFVLDRKRLATYTDDASQFDNRHTAKVPSSPNLTALGTKNVVYITPSSAERQELDDLVDDFLGYAFVKMTIRTVPATAFEKDASATTPLAPSEKALYDGGALPYAGPYFYGGSRTTHPTFWLHWTTPSQGLSANDVQVYTPTARTTPYSAGTPSPGVRTRPTNFGMVPVAVAVGTGVILGARLSRSGSWNRTSYSSSSGGS